MPKGTNMKYHLQKLKFKYTLFHKSSDVIAEKAQSSNIATSFTNVQHSINIFWWQCHSITGSPANISFNIPCFHFTIQINLKCFLFQILQKTQPHKMLAALNCNWFYSVPINQNISLQPHTNLQGRPSITWTFQHLIFYKKLYNQMENIPVSITYAWSMSWTDWVQCFPVHSNQDANFCLRAFNMYTSYRNEK